MFRTQISPQFCLSFSVGGKPQLFRTQISAFSFSSVSQLEETSVVQNSALSTQLWGETSVLPQFLSWGETSAVQNSDLCSQLWGETSVLPQFLTWGETAVDQNSDLSTQLWRDPSVLPQFLSWGETSVVQNSVL